jgi:hypothetical protein
MFIPEINTYLPELMALCRPTGVGICSRVGISSGYEASTCASDLRQEVFLVLGKRLGKRVAGLEDGL